MSEIERLKRIIELQNEIINVLENNESPCWPQEDIDHYSQIQKELSKLYEDDNVKEDDENDEEILSA